MRVKTKFVSSEILVDHKVPNSSYFNLDLCLVTSNSKILHIKIYTVAFLKTFVFISTLLSNPCYDHFPENNSCELFVSSFGIINSIVFIIILRSQHRGKFSFVSIPRILFSLPNFVCVDLVQFDRGLKTL